MMATTARRVKVFTGTWLGRPGTATTYHYDSKLTGKRIDVQVWNDTPEVAEVRAIEGDFWRRPADAREFAGVTVAVAEVEATVEQLARAHFAASRPRKAAR